MTTSYGRKWIEFWVVFILLVLCVTVRVFRDAFTLLASDLFGFG